jgi:hypothetical protein
MGYGKTSHGCLLMALALGPCYAQSPAPSSAPAAAATSSSASTPQSTTSSAAPASTSAASSSASSTDSTPTGPSPDLIKKARNEGFKPEVQKNGETIYCYKDASLGTRFETKKCVNADQLKAEIQRRQDQKDSLGRLRTCTGAGCGAN